MADERSGAEGPKKDRADRNRMGAPERYPDVDRTDGVKAEPRSFRPEIPASMTDGRMGPGGDPCEGKPEA